MPQMSRFALFAFCMLACSASPVAIAPALASDAASSTHDQALLTADGKFVQDLGARAIKVIANKQFSLEQRNTEFAKILNDAFDLKTIGRFVIGRNWANATPAQQDEYMTLFKALVIRNYGDRMTLASGENFEVIGTRPESDMDTTVLSEVTHSDGSKATMIDWRVREKDGKLAVIDVVVEGVSLSVTQRAEYGSIIQNNNGQIEGLLQSMRDELKAPNVASRLSK